MGRQTLVSNTGKASSIPNPLPVTGPLTDAQLRAVAVPVSGPLTDTQLRALAVAISAAALPLPAGAATEATLAKLLPVFKSVRVVGAAGINPTITVPAGKRWRVKLIRFQLVTSAQAATRTAQLAINDPTNNVMFAQAGATQTASLSQGYSFAPSLPNGVAFVGGNITIGFPEVSIDAGYTIITNVVNIQTNDQITMNADVEEFTN